MRVTLAVGLASLLGLATPLTASAHIAVLSPPPRTSSQKVFPCGSEGSVRGTPTVLNAGSTLRVRWNETIDHPGHFRISFDAAGDDGFVDPKSFTDTYTNDAVLLDDIADKKGGEYEVEVKLPNVECDTCTLQVIQVMTDKPPYAVGTNDLYYQCVDLTLTRSPGGGGDAGTMPIDAGMPTVDAGAMGGSDSGPSDDGGATEGDAGTPISDAGPAVDADAEPTPGTDSGDGEPPPSGGYGSCDVHATAREAFHLWLFTALALMLRRMRSR